MFQLIEVPELKEFFIPQDVTQVDVQKQKHTKIDLDKLPVLDLFVNGMLETVRLFEVSDEFAIVISGKSFFLNQSVVLSSTLFQSKGLIDNVEIDCDDLNKPIFYLKISILDTDRSNSKIIITE